MPGICRVFAGARNLTNIQTTTDYDNFFECATESAASPSTNRLEAQGMKPTLHEIRASQQNAWNRPGESPKGFHPLLTTSGMPNQHPYPSMLQQHHCSTFLDVHAGQQLIQLHMGGETRHIPKHCLWTKKSTKPWDNRPPNLSMAISSQLPKWHLTGKVLHHRENLPPPGFKNAASWIPSIPQTNEFYPTILAYEMRIFAQGIMALNHRVTRNESVYPPILNQSLPPLAEWFVG